MPFETASLFFEDADAPRGLARLLTRLREHALLADSSVDADPDTLASEPAPWSTLWAEHGRAPLDDFIDALNAARSAGASRVRFFYVRLAAPSTWPAEWRMQLEEKLGEQPEEPGAIVHIHPYEVVIALDLGDVEGRAAAAALCARKQRPHPHLPQAMRMVDDEGQPIDVRGGFDLRAPPESVGVIAFALERAGVLEGRAVLVRVLD